MAPDRIEREIVVRAPLEDAWAALTEPDRVSSWFGTHTEIDLRPGGAVLFVWKPEERYHAVIEVVEPPHRFAYRWFHEANVTEGPSTRVEFTLEAIEVGTRIRLVESGFASVSEGAHWRSDNEKGWTEELGELAVLLESVA